MNETRPIMQKSRTTAITMLVLAAGMLIACGYVYYESYQAAKETIAKTAPKPSREPGQEPEPPKEASFWDGFSEAKGRPWFWWSLLNAVALGGFGLFYFVRTPTAQTAEEADIEDRHWSKLGVFSIFSIVGFFTVITLALPYTWIKSGELLSRQGWKTSEPWLVVLAYVGGLGGMFVSLLAVRSEERTSPGIRRWIYGYNAFLGALLVFATLGVLNAWFALYGPEPSDWTSTNIYSISPAMKRMLRSLDKPVRAYLIMRQDTALYDDMSKLLENAKKNTDQLEVIEISPGRQPRDVDRLITQYDLPRDAGVLTEGLLILQDPQSAKPLKSFHKRSNLEEIQQPMDPGEAPQRFFKGEQVLFSALRDFRVDKQAATIYFTQNSGEMSLGDPAARGQIETAPQRSLGQLKARLEQSGYVIKPLTLGERTADGSKFVPVPDDAFAVILADPVRLTKERIDLLADYMKRPKKDKVEPGRLILFLDCHFGGDSKVLPTGLEEFLKGFGVQVGQDVLYTVEPPFTQVPAIPYPPFDRELAPNIYGLIQRSQSAPELTECRSIQPVQGGAAFEVQPLLQAVVELQGGLIGVWPEDRLQPNGQAYIENLIKTQAIAQKVRREPMPVAVTVRDPGTPVRPPNPMAPPPPGKQGPPRMLVFGDAGFISDAEAQKSTLGPDIIATSMGWLRGKPEIDSGDVPPRERKRYRLAMTQETLNRILYMPVIWMLLAVIATGVGVAVLRRR